MFAALPLCCAEGSAFPGVALREYFGGSASAKIMIKLAGKPQAYRTSLRQSHNSMTLSGKFNPQNTPNHTNKTKPLTTKFPGWAMLSGILRPGKRCQPLNFPASMFFFNLVRGLGNFTRFLFHFVSFVSFVSTPLKHETLPSSAHVDRS